MLVGIELENDRSHDQDHTETESNEERSDGFFIFFIHSSDDEFITTTVFCKLFFVVSGTEIEFFQEIRSIGSRICSDAECHSTFPINTSDGIDRGIEIVFHDLTEEDVLTLGIADFRTLDFRKCVDRFGEIFCSYNDFITSFEYFGNLNSIDSHFEK